MTQRLRSIVSTLAGLQGAVGVLCLAVGVLLVAGLGWSLIAAGVFLLLGAWSTS